VWALPAAVAAVAGLAWAGGKGGAVVGSIPLFALCLALRRDKETAGIPLILMSAAYTEPADQELARRVGADALLLKTGGFEGVARVLQKVMDAPPQVAADLADEDIEREHARRAQAQLALQVNRTSSLLHRNALQEAQLSILAGISDALSNNMIADGIPGPFSAGPGPKWPPWSCSA